MIVDALVVVLLAALCLGHRKGLKFIRFLAVALTVMLVMLAVDQGLQRAWGRPVRFSDWHYGDDLFHLARATFSPFILGAGLLGVCLGLILTSFCLEKSLLAVGRRLRLYLRRSRTRVGVWLMTLLLIVGVYERKGGKRHWFGTSAIRRVAQTAWQFDNTEQEQTEKFLRGLTAQKEALARFRSKSVRPLALLAGKDVHVFVIEAYGEVNYGDARFRARVETEALQAAARVEKAGYHVLSRYYLSPVYGGASWMAEASFTCGMMIDNQWAYQKLLTSDAKCMEHFFAEAGYHLQEFRPGVRTGWSEGVFFPYVSRYYLPDFSYTGPPGSWDPPSQYTLSVALQRELRNRWERPTPIFSKYVLTSSHAPWDWVFPYVEDWDAVARDGGKIYEQLPRQHFELDRHLLSDGYLGYTAAIGYELKTISHFVQEKLARSAFVVILGDHQPWRQMTGERPSAVPVHILTQDPQVLSAFAAEGFKPGWIPSNDAAGAPPFSEIYPDILGALTPTEQHASR